MTKFKEDPIEWLRQQLPKWKYICPSCKKKIEKRVKRCPFCECKIGFPVRVPYGLNTKQKIRDYVVNQLFPKINSMQRMMLKFHFTDIFASGLETGDLTEFSGSNNTPTVTATDPHSGTKSLECDTHDQYAYRTVSLTEACTRIFVKFQATPPVDGNWYYCRVIAFLGTGGTVRICHCYFEIDDAGNLRLRMHRYLPSEQSTSYVYAWQAGVWYCIELYYKEHASTGFYKLYLNDALIADDSGLNTTANPTCDQIRVGSEWYGRGAGGGGTEWGDVWFDDIVIMDWGNIGTLDLTTEIDYETGDFSQCDGVTASPEINELKRHCGKYSMKSNPAIYVEEGSYKDIGYQKEVYLEMNKQFDALPGVGKYIEFLQIGRSGVSIFKARIYNDAGTVKWSFGHRHNGSFTWANSSGIVSAPTADNWYCIKVQVKCSHTPATSVGIYKMWIDNTELTDISQTSRDTDYIVVNFFRFYTYTDVSGGAITYADCHTIQTTALGACEAAGSEDVPVIDEPADCIPRGHGWLQVFRNCEQIKLINITVDEASGGLADVTVPYDLIVERDDLIHVLCEGWYCIAGKVTEIERNKDAGIKILTLQTKTQRLAGKTISSSLHRIYSGYDFGAVVKDVNDYYFNGLFTSDFVDVNTGYYATEIDLFDKTALSGIEECAKRGNAAFRIDENNKLHYFVRGSKNSRITLSKDNLLSAPQIREVGEPIGRLKVIGYGVEGTAGSGIPERTYNDRRITNSTEAQEVAEALLERFGTSTQITCRAQGFYKARYGESIILDLPEEGYDKTEFVIDQVTWKFSKRACETTFLFGESNLNMEYTMSKIIKEIHEQIVNRISTHSGIETGDTDPFIDFNDILDLATGSEVSVGVGSDTQLRTGTASSETDAAEMAYVETIIERGASGGSGDLIITIDIGGTKYRSWHIEITANRDYYKLTTLLPYDFSGQTVRVYALSDLSVWLTATLKIRQYLKHSHSASQAAIHEFD